MYRLYVCTYVWSLGFVFVHDTIKTACMNLSCVVWVDTHSATDHRNVLLPLEMLLICLCKMADTSTVLCHMAGNPEMASPKSDTSSNQRSMSCQALDVCKTLGFSSGKSSSHRKQYPSFPEVGSYCLSPMHLRMPCPQALCPALLHATQLLTYMPGLSPVPLIPAHRWRCTVQQSA